LFILVTIEIYTKSPSEFLIGRKADMKYDPVRRQLNVPVALCKKVTEKSVKISKSGYSTGHMGRKRLMRLEFVTKQSSLRINYYEI
jgi:hypothetical protein